MQQLNAMKSFPNGTPIDSVQVRLSKVYEYKDLPDGKYGPTTVQQGKIEDASGNSMKIEVWGHPDLAKVEGQELVIMSGKGGKGLAIKHNSYTKNGSPVTDIILSVQKAGQFQRVAVYNAQTQGAAPAAPKIDGGAGIQSGPTPVASAGPIHPATAGAATNKAVEILIEAGVAYEMANQGKLTEAIVAIGSQIAAGAIQIEKGVRVSTATQDDPKAKETPKAVNPEPRPPEEGGDSPDGGDSDVPF